MNLGHIMQAASLYSEWCETFNAQSNYSVSFSLRTYYHIALLLELQDGEGGAPYPM